MGSSPIDLKRCRDCGENKPLAAFYAHKWVSSLTVDPVYAERTGF